MKKTTTAPAAHASENSLNMDILRIVGIAIVYFCAHQLSSLFPDTQKILMAIWPAAGIGLAALLLNQRRLWLPILASLFIAGTLSGLLEHRLLLSSIGFMIANCTETLACALLITKWSGTSITFTRIQEIVALLAAAVVVNAGIACFSAGVAALSYKTTFRMFWETWCIAHSMGILLITPLIVTWSSFRISQIDKTGIRRLEALLSFILWIIAGWESLHTVNNDFSIQPYMLFVLIAWIGIRYGQRAVTLALTLLAVITITHDAVIYGPLIWGGENFASRVLFAQKYLVFITASGLLLTAIFAERKKTDAILQESEESYRSQFATNSIVMIMVDPISVAIIEANDAAEKFYGYTRTQMLSMTIQDLDTRPAFMIKGEIVGILKNQSMQFETEHRLADGSIRNVEVSVSSILFMGRTVLYSIVQDITKSKQTADAIAAERKRLAITLRSISEGVISVDAQGTIVMINRPAEMLTGWNADQALGRNIQDVFVIVNEFTRNRCENPVEIALKTGSLIELGNDVCLIAKDTTERLVSVNVTPLRYGDSNDMGCVLFFKDITQKQKLDDSMQRTQKLESLGVLAGGIAHDFNNLLSGLFGYLEMAKYCLDSDKPDKCRESIVKAEDVFERAKGLTQQLLTFSRGGSPKRTTMQIKPLIERNTRFVLSGSNITCHYDISDSLWLCDVDENQLGQVIDNLVINAMQAMPEGGDIVISAKNIVADTSHVIVENNQGRFVWISIKDTGTGIPRDVIGNIFDPFFSTKKTGHGLGLATVHSIIQHHNGWIDVESEPGKGTTFNLFIPASIQKKPIVVDTSAIVNHKGSGTILVMDDEVYVLDILSGILTSMGYSVKLARNGNEAIALVKGALAMHQPFVVLLLDLTIPGGIGGKDTLAEILKIDPSAIAIASSGYSNDPVMAFPGNFGFKDKLNKPYRKQDVAEVLTKVFGVK